MKFFIFIITLLFSFVLGADTASLKILATTDIHGYMLNFNYYQNKEDNTVGLNKLAGTINKIRTNNKNVILVDNGDLIQGNPLADYIMSNIDLAKTKNPIIQVMEYLKYDVISLGNHEFNYGLNTLNNIIKNSSIPFINSNVYDAKTKENYFTPYVILNKEITLDNAEKSILRVGITGVVPPQILLWDKTNLEGKVMVEDIISNLKSTVKKLKDTEKVDIVIVVAHSGMGVSSYDRYKKNSENTVPFIAKIKGVDFIVTGHDHNLFPNKVTSSHKGIDNTSGTVYGIPTVMSGSYAKNLGEIDVTLNLSKGKWKIQNTKVTILDGGEVDKNVNKIIAPIHKKTVSYMNQSLNGGKSSNLTGPKYQIANYFALVTPDLSIQLANRAFIDYIKTTYLKNNPQYKNLPILSAMAPFKNGSRGGADNYTVVEKGNFSLRSASDLYLYPNTMVILKINAKELKEWLEWSAQIFNHIENNNQELINSNFPTFNFDIIDGITYTIDTTVEARYDEFSIINKKNHRIVNLQYNGKNIQDKDEFLVATNNYRADTNPIINKDSKNTVLDTAIESRSIIIDYIKKQKNINYTVDNNWKLDVGNFTTWFLSSPDGKLFLSEPENKNIKFLHLQENGFAKYSFSNK